MENEKNQRNYNTLLEDIYEERVSKIPNADGNVNKYIEPSEDVIDNTSVRRR